MPLPCAQWGPHSKTATLKSSGGHPKRRWYGLAILAFLLCVPARADLFHTYRPVREFTLPAGAQVFDALSDGRIVALSGADVYIESATQSATFTLTGTLPFADIPAFGAAFLKVSPDGDQVAVGNNGGAFGDNYQVGVFDIASLTGIWFTAVHLDAAWFNSTSLAITAGDFVNPSIVTVLDTNSPDPEDPNNITVVANIGGASAGIAFDTDGNLYTGNGFTFAGPSGTGAVKAFLFADWSASVAGGPPLDFENDGVLVVDVLSASPLGFDVQGNLFIGGGDSSSSYDNDFVAVIRSGAITATLGGSGQIDPSDPAEIRHLDPISANDFSFFTASGNSALQELYVRDFGSPTVYVYADAAPVPAASTWGLGIMALVLLIAGTIALSQSEHSRRHSSPCAEER